MVEEEDVDPEEVIQGGKYQVSKEGVYGQRRAGVEGEMGEEEEEEGGEVPPADLSLESMGRSRTAPAVRPEGAAAMDSATPPREGHRGGGGGGAGALFEASPSFSPFPKMTRALTQTTPFGPRGTASKGKKGGVQVHLPPRLFPPFSPSPRELSQAASFSHHPQSHSQPQPLTTLTHAVAQSSRPQQKWRPDVRSLALLGEDAAETPGGGPGVYRGAGSVWSAGGMSVGASSFKSKGSGALRVAASFSSRGSSDSLTSSAREDDVSGSGTGFGKGSFGAFRGGKLRMGGGSSSGSTNSTNAGDNNSTTGTIAEDSVGQAGAEPGAQLKGIGAGKARPTRRKAHLRGASWGGNLDFNFEQDFSNSAEFTLPLEHGVSAGTPQKVPLSTSAGTRTAKGLAAAVQAAASAADGVSSGADRGGGAEAASETGARGEGGAGSGAGEGGVGSGVGRGGGGSGQFLPTQPKGPPRGVQWPPRKWTSGRKLRSQDMDSEGQKVGVSLHGRSPSIDGGGMGMAAPALPKRRHARSPSSDGIGLALAAAGHAAFPSSDRAGTSTTGTGAGTPPLGRHGHSRSPSTDAVGAALGARHARLRSQDLDSQDSEGGAAGTPLQGGRHGSRGGGMGAAGSATAMHGRNSSVGALGTGVAGGSLEASSPLSQGSQEGQHVRSRSSGSIFNRKNAPGLPPMASPPTSSAHSVHSASPPSSSPHNTSPHSTSPQTRSPLKNSRQERSPQSRSPPTRSPHSRSPSDASPFATSPHSGAASATSPSATSPHSGVPSATSPHDPSPSATSPSSAAGTPSPSPSPTGSSGGWGAASASSRGSETAKGQAQMGWGSRAVNAVKSRSGKSRGGTIGEGWLVGGKGSGLGQEAGSVEGGGKGAERGAGKRAGAGSGKGAGGKVQSAAPGSDGRASGAESHPHPYPHFSSSVALRDMVSGQGSLKESSLDSQGGLRGALGTQSSLDEPQLGGSEVILDLPRRLIRGDQGQGFGSFVEKVSESGASFRKHSRTPCHYVTVALRGLGALWES